MADNAKSEGISVILGVCFSCFKSHALSLFVRNEWIMAHIELPNILSHSSLNLSICVSSFLESGSQHLLFVAFVVKCIVK